MGFHHPQIISISLILIIISPIFCEPTSSTAKPPPKKYPIRTMIGNMYHRIRTNRTGYLLIPPLLRLAYQYGPNLIERMGNALGFGASGAASGAAEAAGAGVAAGIDGLVNSALSGAIGGPAPAAAGQALGALGAGAIAPQLAPFGAAPIGFPPRPLFFRRR